MEETRVSNSQPICRNCGCENAEIISIPPQQKFENVGTRNTIVECSTIKIQVGDSFLQQMCRKCVKESNTTSMIEKQLKEMDSKFKTKFEQLDQAANDLGEGGAQIKMENELKQEVEDSFSNSNLEYDLALVKVKEEEVEFYIAEPYSCKECNLTYNGLATCGTHCESKDGNLSENVMHTQNIADDEDIKDDTVSNEPGTSAETYRCEKTMSLTLDKSNERASKHTNLTKIKCEVCNGTFKPGYLKQHMMTHAGEKPFKCHTCDARFTRKSNLKAHMMGKKRGEKTGEKRLKCDVCDHTFTRMTHLKDHMMTHTGEKPFKCDVCDSRFTRKPQLKLHMMTHTGEKPLKCDLCDYRFVKKTDLKLHVMTHTGEKQFKCDVCGCTFIRKIQLKLHAMTHTGEKPFKCDVCDCRFTRKPQLKLHMMTHTGEKPFKCDICDCAFTRKQYLTIHMMTHTGGKPFQCGVCHHRFIQKSQLNRHMRTHTDGTSKV